MDATAHVNDAAIPHRIIHAAIMSVCMPSAATAASSSNPAVAFRQRGAAASVQRGQVTFTAITNTCIAVDTTGPAAVIVIGITATAVAPSVTPSAFIGTITRGISIGHRPSGTAAAPIIDILIPAATFITAIVMTHPSRISRNLSPPLAGVLFVAMALAHGVIPIPAPRTGGGGGDSGAQVVRATATIIPFVVTVTNSIPRSIPLAPYLQTHPGAGPPPAIILDGNPSLLPMILMISNSTSAGDRRCSSGGPLRDRRIRIHSPPLPTVAEVGVAWHGSDRPSALFDATSNATPPRPGPASLLSSSLRPQPGHSMPRGGRVGIRLRAARTASAGARCVNVCAGRRTTGIPDPVTLVAQEKVNVVSSGPYTPSRAAPRCVQANTSAASRPTIDGAA